MIENRSVPPDTVLPHVMYQDVAQAIAWLRKTFGFREHYRYGDPAGPISGAQVHLGNAWIMLKAAQSGNASPSQLGYGTQSLTVFVNDVDAHYCNAKAVGAEILEEPHVTVYGERQYAARDLDGHHWLFSQHVLDLGPEEWGATVLESATRLGCLRRPRLCYLEIPALNLPRSTAFYEKVFGWNIRRQDTERPSFDDATGNVSGAWVTGRAPAREASLLPYIWVDRIDETLASAVVEGGEIVEPVHEEGGDCWIAILRDPAGNLLGLYQEGAR